MESLETSSPSTSSLLLPPESVVTDRSLVDLIWELRWQGENIQCTELLFSPFNVWRDLDLSPPFIIQNLPGQAVGVNLGHQLPPGEVLPRWEADLLRQFPLASFAQGQVTPRLGRFYPRGLLREFPDSLVPCRCVGRNAGSLTVDLNHPLANRTLGLTVKIMNIRRKKGDTGGQCQDWLASLLDGPGQQVRWRGQPTDFFGPDALARQDERPDEQFYANPRLVSHLDAQARQTITELYGRLLKPGWRVLDLMSSWQSHLPPQLRCREVIGLGLNATELEYNPQLTGSVVHDLNADPHLPFPEAHFDAVICTVSVEYLTRPLEVWAEVRRVLQPGGLFVVTFSNRWFPPKVIRVWTELLDFERLGLTLEYFLLDGGFTALETFSARGWPRPPADKYFPQIRWADPVFAAWGRKQG